MYKHMHNIHKVPVRVTTKEKCQATAASALAMEKIILTWDYAWIWIWMNTDEIKTATWLTCIQTSEQTASTDEPSLKILTRTNPCYIMIIIFGISIFFTWCVVNIDHLLWLKPFLQFSPTGSSLLWRKSPKMHLQYINCFSDYTCSPLCHCDLTS